MDAGPELNKAVSEITGIPLMECIEGDWYDFEPSTNWDDAIEAAEKVGLFTGDDTSIAHTIGYDGAQWSVQAWDEPPLEYIGIKAPTGPLAICRAILALSSRTDTRSCSSES